MRIGVGVAVYFRSQGTVPSKHRYDKGYYPGIFWP